MKKLFIVLLAVAILVPSFGMGIPQAKAVESTNAQLEQMVQQLLTVVAQLRAQLEARNVGGVVVSPSPLPSPSPGYGTSSVLFVEYPNGGEVLSVGGGKDVDFRIKWGFSGLSNNAIIDAYLGFPDGGLCKIGRALAYKREIPITFGGNYTCPSIPRTITSGMYKVALYAFDNGNYDDWVVKDMSDGFFTIIVQNTTNQAPVITGISGPSTLQVGQMGTWTVNAYDPEQGNLSYSVDWEGTAGKPAPSSSGTKQTATFTHVYYNAGTYTPTFTVMDNQGLTAQSSLSVVVGGAMVGTAQFDMGSTYFPTSQNIYAEPGATELTVSSFTVRNNSNLILSFNSLEFFLFSFPQDKKGIVSMYIYDGSTLIASSPVFYPSSGATPRVFFSNLQDDMQIAPGTTRVYVMKADILSNAPVGMTQQIAIAGTNSVPGGPRIVSGNIDGNKVIISQSPPSTPSIETSLVSGVGSINYYPTGGTRFDASFKINVTARSSDVIIEPGAFKESLFDGNGFVQSISAIDNQSYTIPKNQTKLVSVVSSVPCPPPISFGKARLDFMKWKSANGVYSTHAFTNSYMTSPSFPLTPDPVFCPPSPSPSPTPTKPPSVNQDTSLISSQLANALESARKALAEILKMIQSR